MSLRSGGKRCSTRLRVIFPIADDDEGAVRALQAAVRDGHSTRDWLTRETPRSALPARYRETLDWPWQKVLDDQRRGDANAAPTVFRLVFAP